MRTIRTKVYKFSELSEQAKERAIEQYRNSDPYNQHYYDEIIGSVKEIVDLFNLKTGRQWSDIRTSHIEDNICELKGVRLYKYIMNNYGNVLYQKKTYHFCRMEDGTKRFNCVGHNSGKYVSNCQTEIASCPLTGVCYDMDILQPVYDFLKRPDQSTTFEDLMNGIGSSISKTFDNTEKWLNSEEFIKDEIEANDYDFTKDGKQF